MEKQFSREEMLMKRLLKEAGTEMPSANFKNNIMQKLAARERVITPYKPLISKQAWMFIFCLSVLWIGGLYFLDADMNLKGHFELELPQFFDMPEIKVAKTMQYAIGFIALFLIQVPFLKRFLDKQYQL